MRKVIVAFMFLFCATVSQAGEVDNFLKLIQTPGAQPRRFIPEATNIPNLPPMFAQQYLRGDAYVAWALQHNKRAYEDAKARREPGSVAIVIDYQGETYGNQTVTFGVGYGSLSTGDSRTNVRQVTRSYETVGYGGGPVTIYNPYVSPE
jgi:hypothetical protein